MSRNEASIALLPALPPLLFWLAVILLPPLNHDVAGLLAFTGRWLDGEDLYTELIEVNPPLILLMNVPAVLLGRLLPGGPVLALQLLLLAACAASALLSLRLLAAEQEAGPMERAGLGIGLAMVLLIPGAEFGQREHIMMVLALPYLLLTARRIEGRPAPPGLALPIAALAAVGFALKPHFLAFPLLLEAWVLWRRGRGALRDPVPWIMAALWLLYLVVLLLWFADYLMRVVPLARADYLAVFPAGWVTILLTDRVLPFLLLLLALGLIALRRRLGTQAMVLALVGLASVPVAIAQQKGFGYHTLPLRMAALLLLVLVGLRLLDRALPEAMARRGAGAARAAVAWGLGCLAMLGAEAPWAQLHYQGSEPDQLAELFTTEAAGQAILVLSPAVSGIYPALNYAEARNILPTMTIWPLQAHYIHCPPPARLTPAGMDRDQRWFFQTAVARFAQERPRLLVVAPDQQRAGCEPFDLLRYFSQHPLFVRTLRDYRPGPGVLGYRVWRRIGPSGGPRVAGGDAW